MYSKDSFFNCFTNGISGNKPTIKHSANFFVFFQVKCRHIAIKFVIIPPKLWAGFLWHKHLITKTDASVCWVLLRLGSMNVCRGISEIKIVCTDYLSFLSSKKFKVA